MKKKNADTNTRLKENTTFEELMKAATKGNPKPNKKRKKGSTKFNTETNGTN